jgi:hypothetical protein
VRTGDAGEGQHDRIGGSRPTGFAAAVSGLHAQRPADPAGRRIEAYRRERGDGERSGGAGDPADVEAEIRMATTTVSALAREVRRPGQRELFYLGSSCRT